MKVSSPSPRCTARVGAMPRAKPCALLTRAAAARAMRSMLNSASVSLRWAEDVGGGWPCTGATDKQRQSGGGAALTNSLDAA